MAWFRRGAESPSPAEAAPEDDGDLIRQERAPVGDWMTMAPMAPTFGAMPPSFRVQTVAEIMPSHQSPRLSGEMGHSVSASAPSGLVDGLAVSTGAVAATGGHDDLPLREPHHEEPAESPLAALSVRPLAAVTDPEPLPISRLPEPVVSRSLSDAGPAAAPTAPAPALPESLASPEAPLGSDARVGGFGATIDDDGEDLTKGSGDHTELFTPQPDELAPPILPQVRRGGAQELPVMPTIGASPLVGADAGDAIGSAAPPVSKAVGPGAGSLPLARVAEQAGALTPPTPAPVQRHADHAPTPPATASSPTAPAPAAEPDDEAPLLGSSSPSLAANPNETDDGPPVQRRLDTAGPAPTSLEPALGLPLPLVATPPPSPPAPADGPSVSRATDDEVEDGATSPLVGDADLGVPVAPGSPGDDVSGDATSGPGPVASLDLPLVDPAAGGPTSAAQTNDSVAATAGDRAAASGGDSASAPPADSAAAAPGE
ncbi:MAG: hypothetical protein QOF60_1732, partial [Actinomycetota bacterium]|nr:hypothetical protein [Actinomycetota bacterium]